MTDSDTQTVTWKPIRGFSSYEASDHGPPDDYWRGEIRSVDRVTGGRSLKGVMLTQRLNNSGYPVVNVTDDKGVKHPGTTVHSLQMLAFVGECPAGFQVRHLDDNPQHNVWAPTTPPGNLVYGPKWAQEDDKYRNGRPRPVRYEPRPCIRCGNPVDKGGRRCHACVVELGEEAGQLLRAGVTLEEVNNRLGYGNAAYLHTLAVKYGGWGSLTPPASQSVTPASATFRDLFRRLVRR
jgi:hypothetical protein